MKNGFILDTLDSYADLGIIVEEIENPFMGSLSSSSQDVSGMTGAIFQGTSISSKKIVISCVCLANSAEERAEKEAYIANVLRPFTTNEVSLRFKESNDWEMYVHLSEITSSQRVLKKANSFSFTITFEASDPHQYGKMITQEIRENPVTITADGYSDIKPVFTCIPDTDITKMAIVDDNGDWAYIGNDVDFMQGETPVNNEPLILDDKCSTTVPWTSLENADVTFKLDGTASGSLKIHNDSIQAKSFGENMAGYHGPAFQQYLGQECEDYRVRVRLCNLQHYARSRGAAEFYLLDANGARIGKVALNDKSDGKDPYIVFSVESGSNFKYVYNSSGTVKKGKVTKIKVKTKNGTKTVVVNKKKKTEVAYKTISVPSSTATSTFTNFYGYLDVLKIGNKYTFSVMKLKANNAGNAWSKPITTIFTDTKNTYNKKLAGIAFFLATADLAEDRANPPIKYTVNTLAITDVKVWNILNGGNGITSKQEIIARAGEELRIDSEDGCFYKNGEPFMDNFYIGSKFPKFTGGVPIECNLFPKPSNLRIDSDNLVNESTFDVGYLQASTGKLMSSSNDTIDRVSTWIACVPTRKLAYSILNTDSNSVRRIFFYTKSKTFINYIEYKNTVKSETVTVPANAYYCKVYAQKALTVRLKLEIGTVATAYNEHVPTATWLLDYRPTRD
ncbi:phage tail protein [Brochothrix thermosphacta]|uniref:Phage tail protein n=1 Tax=Brochothrix thermosphacta TaxID=2756 RepID=A0A291BV31_BROTH|nr:phage tail domain-containing protein [Brochothrix thermosphacta]ATF25043.1 phage tail protein [Brochothrix thermosphacta]